MKPLLVFDSGIGGLTVLREARVLMPQRRYLYIADDAGFPYGAWDETALKERIVDLLGEVIEEHQPQLAIIACNTASTLALEALRQTFHPLPFVGTVPAIKPAAERTYSGLISVLATPGTVERGYTRDLIAAHAAQCDVQLVGSSKLAAMAEAYVRGQALDERQVAAEIAPCFVERDGRRTDIVVLACTHYPFLANLLRRLAPWPVDWLDPAEAIARRAASLLSGTVEQGEAAYGEDLAIFTSGQPDFAVRRLIHGFGLRGA